MTIDQQKSDNVQHVDRSAWVIWGVLVVIAVAILPFAVRNSEIVRHIARCAALRLVDQSARMDTVTMRNKSRDIANCKTCR